MKQPDTLTVIGIAAVALALISVAGLLPDLSTTKTSHAQEPAPVQSIHAGINGRYSVSWQQVGGEVKEPFNLMILKDVVDGRCYLIDGTLTETQVNFGPQVPCE